jgi:hypothetical protein
MNMFLIVLVTKRELSSLFNNVEGFAPLLGLLDNNKILIDKYVSSANWNIGGKSLNTFSNFDVASHKPLPKKGNFKQCLRCNQLSMESEDISWMTVCFCGGNWKKIDIKDRLKKE